MPDELKNINTNLIDPPKNPIRETDTSTPEYLALCKSIKANGGLTNSILVRPKAGGRYERVDGGHRLAAYEELGKLEIPCIVREMTDEQAMIAQFTNAVSVPTTKTQYARHLLRMLRASPDMSLGKLAHVSGMSAGWIKNQLLLLNIHPRYQGLVDRGNLCASNAYELGRLPESMQPRHLASCRDMPTKAFREMIAEIVRQLSVDSKTRSTIKRLEQKEFKPKMIVRSNTVISNELRTKRAGAGLLAAVQPNTLLEAFHLGVKWVACLDPVILERRRKEFAEKKLQEYS